MTEDLATTPLTKWHDANGGRMVDFAGWLMPVQYSSIVAEHQATRKRVTLFDVSHMGRFRFLGNDADRFLDRMITRDVRDLRPGKIRYSLMTNDQGGIKDDILVYHLTGLDGSPFFSMVVNAGNREKIASWLNQHIDGREDVQFVDQTRDTAMIAVQGPLAEKTSSAFVGDQIGELPYYGGVVTKLMGHEVILSRTGYTGEDGFEMTVPARLAVEVWESLLESGQDAGILPAGLGARDTLRLEAAMPLYGHELSEEINPYQAGLRFAVDSEGRQFPGRDALEQLGENTVCRVGLELCGKRAARQHADILLGNEPIGEVTSGAYSPTLHRPIAMGFVRHDCAAPGRQLSVDIRGNRHDARVVKLPFYKRGKKGRS